MVQENDILKGLERGEKAAFETLYSIWAPKCVAFALVYVKNEQVAMDITHDVFVKIWLKRSEVSRVKSIGSYLFRMVRNLVLDRMDHAKVKDRYAENQKNFSDRVQYSIDERMEYDDLLGNISEIISAMPPVRRKVFQMSRFEGKSISEISTEMGISTGTVENHITNALRDLREGLKQID